MSDTNNKIILEVGLKGKENVAEVQKAYDSYMHTLSETAAQVRQVNAAHTESKKELKLQDELARSVAGSYNALSAQYSLNRIQINQMSADELKNTEAGQKLVSETAAIREEMKKSQESTGNNSLSVGSYTDSIKNAISQTGLFGTELGVVSKVQSVMSSVLKTNTDGQKAQTAATEAGSVATGGMSKAMGILKLAFASTGIGLLVIAVLALYEYFTKSSEGAGKLKVILAVVGSVVNNVTDLFVKLGKEIFSAIENPKAAFVKFKDLIEENITNRISGIINLLPSLGKALKEAFSGNFSAAAKTAADAAGQVVLGVKNVTTKAAELTRSALNNMTDDAKKAAEAQKMISAANKLERAERIRDAKEEVKISDLQAKAKDSENYSAKQRLAFTREAGALTIAQIAREEKVASLRYEAIKIQNTLHSTVKADLDAETDAHVTLINVETKGNEARKEMYTQIKKLVKAANADDKARADAKAKLATDEMTLEQKLVDFSMNKTVGLAADEKKVAEEKAEYDANKTAKELSDAWNKLKVSESTKTENLKKIEDARQSVIASIQAKYAEDKAKADKKKADDTLKATKDLDQRIDEYEISHRDLSEKEKIKHNEKKAEYDANKAADEMEESIKTLDINESDKTDKLKQIESDRQEAILSIQKKYAAEQVKADKKNDTDKRKRDKESLKAKIDIATQGFDAISELAGKESTVGKLASAASALINTYEGVTNVWAAKSVLPEPLATVSKVVSTATVLASGLAAVRNIKSTTYATGGIVSGEQISGDNINAKLNSGEMVLNKEQQTRLFNQANNGTSGSTLDSDAIADIVIKSIKNIPVTVAESDITYVQNKVKVQESRFSV